MLNHDCSTCALPSLYGGLCPVFRADMSGHKGCPKYTVSVEYCELCGQPIIGPHNFIHDEGILHRVCSRCLDPDYLCPFCVNANECRFETDDTCHEPPVVMTQSRQGNMIVSQQIKNPRRITATCANGCKCYHNDFDGTGICCKDRMNECGGCINFKYNWRR